MMLPDSCIYWWCLAPSCPSPAMQMGAAMRYIDVGGGLAVDCE